MADDKQEEVQQNENQHPLNEETAAPENTANLVEQTNTASVEAPNTNEEQDKKMDVEGTETPEQVVEEVARLAEQSDVEPEVRDTTEETNSHTTVTEDSKAAAAAVASEEDDEEVDEDEEEEEIVQDDTPHDDFDWGAGKRNSVSYSEDERKKLFAEYDNTLGSVSANEIIKGKVVRVKNGDVIIDFDYKSDGVVSESEFRDREEPLQPGDTVEVYLESVEDKNGQMVLSRRKAKLLLAWESIKDSFENGTIIKGVIVSKTKGGLIADVQGLETFLPGSQIDIRPIIDYDAYVGKEMESKVVKINEAIKNAVVSHKALIESDLAEQREAIISSLERGQVLEGLVKNITDFGAFLDLGGVDGLLYITDISWGRIKHPSEKLELNQKVNVVVLDFDENKKRISLGLKQLTPHPWEALPENVHEGATIQGKVVNIEDYGAFLEVIPGVEGLVHVSEVTWSNQPVNAREYFTVGETIPAKIVTIDNEDRKMSLSIKQLTQDPWSTIAERYPEGSRTSGRVRNLTPYGVFLELEEGIGGMIHISDLSWTKRYSHPSEFTKVGETLDVQVLEVDNQNRKMSLGFKQLEENPWDTFEEVFPMGSYHNATVIRRDDRGGVVQLPYGLEAFSPLKHLRKEDNSLANVDDQLMVKVIEFNRDDKRIMVSHTRYLDDLRRDERDTERRERDTERRETRKVIKETNTKVERTTLGDLAGLSQLKQQLEANESDDNGEEE